MAEKIQTKYGHGLGGGGYFSVDPLTDAIGDVVPWYGLRAYSPSTDQSNEVVYADDDGIYDSYAGVATDNVSITGYKTPDEAWRSFGMRVLGNGLVRDQSAYDPFGVYFRTGTDINGVYEVTIYYKLNGTTPTGDSEADEDKRTISEREHQAIAVTNKTALDDKGQATSMIKFTVNTKDSTDPNKALYDKLYPTGSTKATIPLPTELKPSASK